MNVTLNEVSEWEVVNDLLLDDEDNKEYHPFHLHTNHFQVINATRLDLTADYRLGDWRDTIIIPPMSKVTIRFIPTDFVGLSLAHCHTLTHEDTGMMIAFNLVS